ncbi:MAG: endo-1,4-beta-xylanase [Spirochaetales bacterium]|nr:endo-1,4-beta-xylanase [Spirochaetales bacterium]MBQ4501957.1 endo-1,4-beta-xylanase [Spirochaetales bacterium]MBQ7282772.1 endo-1,4-beta-xylanase [Spirochaetales bacterium]MBQ9809736.1 endo-1,4-beta-xylanase [Spirochaetales bacterium]
MRKALSLFHVLLLVVCLLVSCATAQNESVEVPASETGQAEDTSATMEDVLMSDPASLSLYKTYEPLGLMMGTDLNADYISNTWCSNTLDKQFNIFVPSYGLKPNKILDQKKSQENGKLTIVLSDELVSCLQWAKDHGKRMHGHTMIWWKDTPDWIFREGFSDDGAYVSRDVLLERMEGYICDTFEALRAGGWIDMFVCYDVVNEYIDILGKAPNDSPWVSIIGEDAIWHAFNFARKYAPENMSLVYNENYCENNRSKAEATVAMVKTLVDENGNSLVDCLGLQGHITLTNKIDTICDNIRYVAQNIGDLEIQITEFDCNFLVNAKTAQEKMKKQGTYYYQVMETVLDLMRSGARFTAFSCCGFKDDMSWLGLESGGAPVLYDANGREKYSYFGLLQMRELSGFED